MSDPLELDQADFHGRICADEYFADVPVLLLRKGVTESDIEVALSTLTEKSGKLGVVAVVLMPEVAPRLEGAPGPEYDVTLTVQVVESPEFNLGATGIGKSAEQLVQRLRQILHHFDTGGRNTFNFAGVEPLPTTPDKVSYGVRFKRHGRDARAAKVATPTIATAGALPEVTVTLACATAGAAIHYTTDGSYPGAANANATLYTVPFVLAVARTVRTAASLANYQQSNVTQAEIS